ncbi:MAG: hypothetical protein ACYDD1_02990 [Caulobacteraceae bacterium]
MTPIRIARARLRAGLKAHAATFAGFDANLRPRSVLRQHQEDDLASGVVKTVRVHYRKAQLEEVENPAFTLQQRLTRVMASTHGTDARMRMLNVSEDGQHKGCLNFAEVTPAFFVADIMHLDGRDVLPRWIVPTEPKPVAEVVPREIPEGEASLGESLYIMVRGNHVAAIERLGFRTRDLAHYINALLKTAGELEDGAQWLLVPKVEIVGSAGFGGAVKRVVLKPRAALMGDGPSQAPEPKVGKRGKRAAAAVAEDLAVLGHKVVAMLVAAGADEAKIERLRETMSTDLILRARLEISVASVKRKTTAEISPAAVQQALAEMAADGEVIITSGDGKSDGKLVQLVHKADVLETGGLIDWQRATQALASAMSAWAAKGAIELAT